MEAPEYAKKLFNKFKSIKIIFIETESGQTKEASIVVTDELAKQSALIEINDLINFAEKVSDIDSNFFRLSKTGNYGSAYLELEYLLEVKQEIEKLV